MNKKAIIILIVLSLILIGGGVAIAVKSKYSSSSVSGSNQPKSCPKNCSGNGTCDTKTGVCLCKSGYGGTDCSLTCPSSCKGSCDYSTDKVVCKCADTNTIPPLCKQKYLHDDGTINNFNYSYTLSKMSSGDTVLTRPNTSELPSDNNRIFIEIAIAAANTPDNITKYRLTNTVGNRFYLKVDPTYPYLNYVCLIPKGDTSKTEFLFINAEKDPTNFNIITLEVKVLMMIKDPNTNYIFLFDPYNTGLSYFSTKYASYTNNILKFPNNCLP